MSRTRRPASCSPDVFRRTCSSSRLARRPGRRGGGRSIVTTRAGRNPVGRTLRMPTSAARVPRVEVGDGSRLGRAAGVGRGARRSRAGRRVRVPPRRLGGDSRGVAPVTAWVDISGPVPVVGVVDLPARRVDVASPSPTDDPDGFGHWLAGFTDGEGHFGLIHSRRIAGSKRRMSCACARTTRRSWTTFGGTSASAPSTTWRFMATERTATRTPNTASPRWPGAGRCAGCSTATRSARKRPATTRYGDRR